MFVEEVWPPVPLFRYLPDPFVRRNFLDRGIATREHSGEQSARLIAVQRMLRGGPCIRPRLNHLCQGMANQIRPTLKEPVQPEQTVRLRAVAVAHGLHQDHMLAHYWAEKTAEARKRAYCFERRLRVRIQQRPHNWCGRSLSILDSQIGEWIVCECSVIYPPVQKTVDKARAIRDYVERPRQRSILEPLPYSCLRLRFVLRLLGNEALESIQNAEVNLGRHRTTQTQLSDVILGRCPPSTWMPFSCLHPRRNLQSHCPQILRCQLQVHQC